MKNVFVSLFLPTWNPVNTHHCRGTFCHWPAVAGLLALEILKTNLQNPRLFPFSCPVCKKIHIYGYFWCLRRFRRLYFKQMGLSVSKPSWYKRVSSALHLGQRWGWGTGWRLRDHPRGAQTAFRWGFDCCLVMKQSQDTVLTLLLTSSSLPTFLFLVSGLPFQSVITLQREGVAVGRNYYISLELRVVLALSFLPLRTLWDK